MPDDNRWVSWRDLSDKLGEVDTKIDDVDKRLVRVETLVCRIDSSIRMRRSTRAAFIGAAGTVAGAVVTASAWLVS